MGECEGQDCEAKQCHGQNYSSDDERLCFHGRNLRHALSVAFPDITTAIVVSEIPGSGGPAFGGRERTRTSKGGLPSPLCKRHEYLKLVPSLMCHQAV
jgi:hypothetical protein